ncbi:MAG: carbohydrate ABC transporter permease [Chloroflexota bacterium]|nr:carbohydrate ABC transporter permease [Chloroflexota bacterium]
MSTVKNIPGAVPAARPRARVRARWLRGSRLRATVVSLVLIPLCFLWIYPFLWMVSSALKSNAEIFAGLSLIPRDIQWSNFARAWTGARIGQYFLNTVIITATSVAIVVVTTAMIGYVLGRYQFPGKKLIVGFFVATVFLPEGYTIIPIFDLINRLGLAETLWGVILAESGGAHVITVLLFAGFFSQLPKELEEAAIVDGAGFFRVFWQIMLPLSTPVIATAIILQFLHSWNDFLLPLVLTLSRPELRTLAVGIYAFRGEFFTDWGALAAAATISLVPIILVFLFLQRYFVQGIAGAVKQ